MKRGYSLELEAKDRMTKSVIHGLDLVSILQIVEREAEQDWNVLEAFGHGYTNIHRKFVTRWAKARKD